LNPEPQTPFLGPIASAAPYILALDLVPVPERQELLSNLRHVSTWWTITIRHDRPDAAANDAAPELEALRAQLWPRAEVYMAATPGGGDALVTVIALRKGAYALVSAPRPSWPGASMIPPPPGGPRPEGPPLYGPSPLQLYGSPGDATGTPPSRLRLRLPPPPLPPPFPGPPSTFIITGSALFFFLCAAILTIWVSNTVVAPLVELARQAEQFPSNSNECELIPVQGPQEVRDLTRALNRMQGRISSMIAARTQTLAAVSHDLKTIITRMRLRAEFIEDAMLRTKMLQDTELMDAMLYKNLQHLRRSSKVPEPSLVDLDSVLQTVSDQFIDLGHDVTYRGGRHQMVLGSLSDLQRVFTNLIENAVTYGEKVVVTIEEPEADVVEIDVADDGPGISTQDKARVMEPFVRGQPGRNMNAHGGFGLGLSIVSELVEDAGGRLRLLDREPHGLIARVMLPRAFLAKPSRR
jgi:signal transduction histidine kinase